MKCIVTDTQGRRYELTASTLVELPTRGFVRRRLVLRADLDNPEFRPAADMIYFYIRARRIKVGLDMHMKHGRLRIGCRYFYQHQANIIRRWSLGG